MPAIWSGYTPKAVQQWPGAMALRPQVFIEMVHDICASIARMGFSKLFMLDCHGQHGPMLNVVTKLIADEFGFYYSSATPVPFFAQKFNEIRKSPQGGASHACEYEASLILHISPELVYPELFNNEDLLQHHSAFIAARRHARLPEGNLVHLRHSGAEIRCLRRSHRRDRGDRPSADRGFCGKRFRVYARVLFPQTDRSGKQHESLGPDLSLLFTKQKDCAHRAQSFYFSGSHRI